MLYIMRHGRTAWNEKNKLQGRTDVPLNEEGRKMAAAASERYRDVHFDICYCSPLVRARETAEIFLKGRNIPILCDDRLKEMSFGICEGIEDPASLPDCPAYVFFHHPEKYIAAEGGESMEDLFERTGSFLREVALPALEEKKDLLIVGHGAMNSSIVCQVRKLPLERFWEAGIENCKLMKLV